MKARLLLLLPTLLSAFVTSAFQTPAPKRAALPSGPRIPRRYRDRDEETEEYVTTRAATAVTEQVASSKHPAATGADFDALRSVAMSQALVLLGVTLTTAFVLAATGHPIDMSSLHWNGSNEFFSFWDFDVTPLRLAEGVIAAVPMVYAGALVENSDDRDASHVNFSTMNMVMSLFGRRKHDHKDTSALSYPAETPMMHALSLSVALAAITGLSEEIMFRGIVPSTLFHFSHSVPITLVGQSLLFGLGHLSPQASLGENKVITGLQATNGLWYGLVYLAAGGDILPCIIAHTLYDIHVFMETWMAINEQMDYTEAAVLERLSPQDELDIRKIKQEAGPSLSTETLAHARRFFYAFDYDHQDSLSKSDVKRAVSYAFLHDQVQPSNEQVGKLFDRMLKQRTVKGSHVSDSNLRERLRLPEFLRLLFLLKAKTQTS
jgi:membrane protease YdiL (CAAX protease family)